jgi:tRNA threonylcarbamoyladenosine biosynthesis protein TsaE
VHVDAYRLRDAGPDVSLDDLDLDDALLDSITVVEWGEGLVDDLAESRLTVVLRRPRGGRDVPDVRFARVLAQGPRWAVVPLPNVTT